MNIYFNKHSFLSNFHECYFVYKDREWSTSEHAYQAMKAVDEKIWEYFRKLPTPTRAKRLGREIMLRENWDSIKVPIMKEILEAKFSLPKLEKKLLETGDAVLIEYAPWGDTFWGVNKNYWGHNNLGILLMEIRASIAER